MTRLSYYEALLFNIIPSQFDEYDMEYIPEERALAELREKTGQDFGYDALAWENWLDSNVADWRFATRPHPQLNFFEGLLDAIYWEIRMLLKHVNQL
jgi:hypothetical protein